MKEVKFKQTEVGMIPNDWEVKRLGNLADIRTGKKNGNEAVENGKYLFFVRSQDVYRINTYSYDGEAILVPGEGNIGSIFHYVNEKFDFHQRVYKISDFPDDISCKFVYYVMKHFFGDWALKKTVKATVDSLRLDTFENFTFSCPPTKKEQTAIATTLGDIDAVISTTEKLIAKKKALKQGAMQTLLSGKMRIQNGKWIKTTNFKQTELGPIPQEWEVKSFGEVGKCFSAGATPYRQINRFYEGNVKWVSSGELDYNIIQDTREHISMEAVKATNLTLHPKGTFLMAITGLEAAGTRGRCAILGCEATTNQSCLAIYESEDLSVPYLYHFYVKYGDALAFAYAQGSKQQSFTAAIVKKLPIVVPSSKEEQTAIATVLSDMDSEIAALETKLAKYRQLKTGMMQQLLTGKIRLV